MRTIETTMHVRKVFEGLSYDWDEGTESCSFRMEDRRAGGRGSDWMVKDKRAVITMVRGISQFLFNILLILR